MSSTLFVIYIEPLLRNIANNIKGINCLGTSMRITAYLDDVNIFAGSKADVLATRREISDYCKTTGAKLNTNKTTVRYTSAWNEGKICEWAQETDNQKILGITFFQTIEETIKQNWVNAERSFYKACAANKYRSLNFYQRATLIREKFTSKSIHLAQILPCPNLIASNIRKAANRFIWNGYRDKTQPGVLYLPVIDGGLGAIEPSTTFKSLFVKTTFNH